MKKIKKLKGGGPLYINDDETLLCTHSSRNTVYVHDLTTRKLLSQHKTVSNVCDSAISPDKKLLAAKNTSGKIELFNLETGESLGFNGMAYTEGEPMVFTADNTALLDFDWAGRTMLLDCVKLNSKILDGPPKYAEKTLPRCSHIQYDRYSNRIYKIMADDYGDSSGRIYYSEADPDNIDFKLLKECDTIPNHLSGISFCRSRNYYFDRNYKEKKYSIVITDKDFSEVGRIPLDNYNLDKLWVSPDEKYIFIDYGKQCDDPKDFKKFCEAPNLSRLYLLDGMKPVQDFDYEYIDDVLMYASDSRLLISTSKGTFLWDIE